MNFDDWYFSVLPEGHFIGMSDAQIAWDAAKADSAQEIERLRAELAGMTSAWRNACNRGDKAVAELAAAKALLREVLDQCRETGKMLWDNQLYQRIRAALGDEPADDATRKQS